MYLISYVYTSSKVHEIFLQSMTPRDQQDNLSFDQKLRCCFCFVVVIAVVFVVFFKLSKINFLEMVKE